MMQRPFPINPFDRPVQQTAPNPFNRPAQAQQQPKDIWQQDAGGATDDTILGLRRRAAKSMRQATDTSPVQHWTQGAARMAEGLNAGLDEAAADRQQRALDDLAHKQAWALNSEYPGLFGAVAPLPLNPPPQAGLLGLGERLTKLFGQRDEASSSGSTGGLW